MDTQILIIVLQIIVLVLMFLAFIVGFGLSNCEGKSEINLRKYEQILDWLNENEITSVELETTCQNYPVISNAEFLSIENKLKEKLINKKALQNPSFLEML